MNILSIDTSCDETSVALTNGRRVLSNVVYSQILLHKKWGGVVPTIAKRAHEERIDLVINECLKKYKSGSTIAHDVDYIAVTQGPGLAIALEVGIRKAKELAAMYGKKIIPMNHLEGHIYSCFAQNRRGNPCTDFDFPYLAMVISGGHTEIVFMKDHLSYEVIGETVDDAAGEALDKAAKMLGLGYPGGAVIEKLAKKVANSDMYKFPRPMLKTKTLQFSFSGLKTSLYYFLKKTQQSEVIKNIDLIASSYQEAVFDTLVAKALLAVKQTGVTNILIGGGVAANLYLRERMRAMIKLNNGKVLFPPYKYLNGDNAAMIGVAAYYKAKNNIFSTSLDELDRMPRFSLPKYDL